MQSLRGLGDVAPSAALTAEIGRLEAIPGVTCNAEPPIYGRVSRKFCPTIGALKSKLAIAHRKEALDEQMDQVMRDYT